MIMAVGLGALLIPCIITDVKYRKLPVVYILAFSAAALVWNLLSGETGPVDMLLGACIGGLFLLVARIARHGMGSGDGFLIFGAGIFCGAAFTVPLILLTFLLVLILGGAYLLFVRKDIHERLPLAPFMGLAGILQITLLSVLPNVYAAGV